MKYLPKHVPAIIKKAGKTVTQSGHAKSGAWELTYDVKTTRRPEALNGWTSADNTAEQIKLTFDSLDDAQNYAEREGLTATIMPHSTRKVRPRNFSDNYKYVPVDDE